LDGQTRGRMGCRSHSAPGQTDPDRATAGPACAGTDRPRQSGRRPCVRRDRQTQTERPQALCASGQTDPDTATAGPACIGTDRPRQSGRGPPHHGGHIARHRVLVGGNVCQLQDALDAGAIHALWPQVEQHDVVFGACRRERGKRFSCIHGRWEGPHRKRSKTVAQIASRRKDLPTAALQKGKGDRLGEATRPALSGKCQQNPTSRDRSSWKRAGESSHLPRRARILVPAGRWQAPGYWPAPAAGTS
jgi:hypothetical protein